MTYRKPWSSPLLGLSVANTWRCLLLIKYKVDESEYISEQEARRGTSQINYNLLERLKDEMRKIHLEVSAFFLDSVFVPTASQRLIHLGIGLQVSPSVHT